MTKSLPIYLDFQASTPISRRVLDKMRPHIEDLYGNPHSGDHFIGWEASKAVNKARNQIANFLMVDKQEIIFTSGATEANNMALKGLRKYLKEKKRTKVIVSSIEHKCVLQSAVTLEEYGFEVIYLSPNSKGIIEPENLEEILNEDVGLVSIMLVNNEIGTIQPVQELAKLAHTNGALFHTDAAQAPIFMNMNIEDIGADLLSLSSHKIYGPKGIGALYINEALINSFKPLIDGGGQERGLRSGTLPTALCVGLGEAIEICASEHSENFKKLKNISSFFWKNLKSHMPDILINGSEAQRHPGNLNIRFPNINSQNLLQAMQPEVAASSGSACNSGIESPSYVLQEIGLTTSEAASSIRFSFGIDQKEEDILKAVRIISDCYQNELLLSTAA